MTNSKQDLLRDLHDLTHRMSAVMLAAPTPEQKRADYALLLKRVPMTIGKGDGRTKRPLLDQDEAMNILVPQLRSDMHSWAAGINSSDDLHHFIECFVQHLIYVEKIVMRLWPPPQQPDNVAVLMPCNVFSSFVDDAFNLAAIKLRDSCVDCKDKKAWIALYCILNTIADDTGKRTRILEKVFQNGRLWVQRPIPCATPWANDNKAPELWLDAQIFTDSNKLEFTFAFLRTGQEMLSSQRLAIAPQDRVQVVAHYNGNDMAQIARETTPSNLHKFFLEGGAKIPGNFTRYAMLQACRQTSRELLRLDHGYGSTHTLFHGFYELVETLDNTAKRLKLPPITLTAQ